MIAPAHPIRLRSMSQHALLRPGIDAELSTKIVRQAPSRAATRLARHPGRQASVEICERAVTAGRPSPVGWRRWLLGVFLYFFLSIVDLQPLGD